MRVLIADPAAHARSALRLLLEQHAAGWCVAELSTGDRLLGELGRADTDILLIDSHIPDLDLIRALPSIRQAFPRLRVIVLSSRPEERVRALAAGADVFVSKGDSPQGLHAILGRGLSWHAGQQ